MHSLRIVQWNSTRRDHPGNPGGVSGSGPVNWNGSYTIEILVIIFLYKLISSSFVVIPSHPTHPTHL